MAEENIFLFYPNLIGYGRIITAIIALYYFPTSPFLTMFFYIGSALLDAADGHVARMFNQSTRFGAMLDMLTDRCALIGLLMGLSVLYPKYALAFQLSVIIDVASHWLFMVTSYVCGKTSHKSFAFDNPVIRLYYSSKKFLFFMCAGNELFYCAMYMMNFYPNAILGFWKILAILCFPVATGKALISLIHLYAASSMLGELDVRERKEKAAAAAKTQ